MNPVNLHALTDHRLFRPRVTLLLLCLLNAWFNPHFFHLDIHNGHLYGSLISILNHATSLMLISLDMTLVTTMGGIDISVGAVVAISGTIATSLVGGTPVVQDGLPVYVTRVPLLLALLTVVDTALVCGIWNGLLVADTGMQPIIATLILMVVGRGTAQLITGGQIITVYYKPFFFVGNGYLPGLPFGLYIAAAVLGLLLLLMHHVALGLFIETVGINPVAARLTGLNTKALLFGIYAFCGAMTGVTGLVICSNIKSTDDNDAGLLLELDTILAVTLGDTSLAGGKSSLWGSVIGALIIQTLIYAIYSMGVPPEINLVIKAVVMFAMCLAQSGAFRSMLFQHHGRAGTQS